ncbi:MAG: hypothetical protein HY202_01330 [Nitrospirae bacterium]|nr:hypothetical protein [Nitrospirota bacterium]MBI3604651.1 hypothetical protein [Nitrospirota bacterium]
MEMDPEIERSLTNVLKSLQDFSSVFDRKIDELRIKGLDEERLNALLEGSDAMKDSASIFLSWAKHYVEKISNPAAEKQTETFYSET